MTIDKVLWEFWPPLKFYKGNTTSRVEFVNFHIHNELYFVFLVVQIEKSAK